MSNLIITIATVGECHRAVLPLREVIKELHISSGHSERRLKRMVYQWSLQIQLERLNFNVFRLFRLDLSLFTAVSLNWSHGPYSFIYSISFQMVATTGIHMIIFFQFTEDVEEQEVADAQRVMLAGRYP